MRSHRANIAAVFTLALALGIALTGCGTADSSNAVDQPKDLPASTSMVAASTTPLSEKLSDRTVEQLRARGTTFAAQSPEGLTRVSATEAATNASNFFRFTAGKNPIEAQFGRVTNTVFTEAAEDGATADKIPLLMKDRPMWLVLFDGVEVPIHRPETKDQQSSKLPATSKKRLLVYIDGITGKYLRASTLSDDLVKGSEPEVSKPLQK
jgi:hypothetical protein